MRKLFLLVSTSVSKILGLNFSFKAICIFWLLLLMEQLIWYCFSFLHQILDMCGAFIYGSGHISNNLSACAIHIHIHICADVLMPDIVGYLQAYWWFKLHKFQSSGFYGYQWFVWILMDEMALFKMADEIFQRLISQMPVWYPFGTKTWSSCACKCRSTLWC